MSYSAGEALVLTRLRGMSQFDTDNSSRGKFGQKNSGSAAQYAILFPGTRTRNKHGMAGKKRVVHQTIIKVYQRYKDDGTSLTDLETLVEAIENELDKYPQMGDATGTIIQAWLVEARDVMEEMDAGTAGPAWLYQELVCEWHEEKSITFA